jgi:hypothetical protein
MTDKAIMGAADRARGLVNAEELHALVSVVELLGTGTPWFVHRWISWKQRVRVVTVLRRFTREGLRGGIEERTDEQGIRRQ